MQLPMQTAGTDRMQCCNSECICRLVHASGNLACMQSAPGAKHTCSTRGGWDSLYFSKAPGKAGQGDLDRGQVAVVWEHAEQVEHERSTGAE